MCTQSRGQAPPGEESRRRPGQASRKAALLHGAGSEDANRRQGIGADFFCWSHAAFNSHGDFDAYHRSIGEDCDYASMKAEMLASVSSVDDASWFDIDLSWLEFPDVDWSIFDFFNVDL
jgi:hypothetical protein